MNKYRRQAFYDYDKKQWRTAYRNTEGKLVIDKKVKTYKQAREQVAKNKYRKPEDIITKKQSIVESVKISSIQQNQKQVEKLIRKKRLSKDEKVILKELSERTGYKRREVKKKTKEISRKKPETVQYYERDIQALYYNTTSTGFYIPADIYKKIKKEIKATFKGLKPDRLQIDVDGMTGSMEWPGLNTQKEFESELATAISGQGEILWTRGKVRLRLNLIKR